MVGIGNGGFAADGRPGEKNNGPAQPGKFSGRKLLLNPL